VNWIVAGADREKSLQALPGIGDRFLGLYASFWQIPNFPPETLELCRLRLAQLHNSEADWGREEVSLDTRKREQLTQWNSSEHFTEAEKACLEITEVHAMDARAITDAQADAVKSHFGEVGLVALFQALGVFDGMIRLGLLWGSVEAEDS
jgi:hypothetical protein